MALWIKLFQAGAEYADCLPADLQSRLMRRAVNAQGQAAGDDKTGARQAAGEGGGGVHAGARCAAAADHGQLGFFQDRRVAGNE